MSGLGVQVFLIVLGFVVLWLTFLRPRGEIQRGPGARPPGELGTREAQNLRDEIDEVFVRLQEYSRETLAKLDTKIRILHQLIQDADARIRRLEELEARNGPGAGGASGAKAGPAGGHAATAGAPGAKAAPDDGHAAISGRAGDAAASPVEPDPLPAAHSDPLPANPLHRRVCELHDRGLTLPEIEAETGVAKGEVELILGMRKLGASRGGGGRG